MPKEKKKRFYVIHNANVIWEGEADNEDGALDEAGVEVVEKCRKD